MAIYFEKNAVIEGTNWPAWFYYWRQVIADVVGWTPDKIRYLQSPSDCHVEGLELPGGCYQPGDNGVFVTSLASGAGRQYSSDETYEGIDLMGMTVVHEKAHHDYFWTNWAPLLQDENGNMDFDRRPLYDGDNDWMVDSEEPRIVMVGNAQVWFDSLKTTTHMFYSQRMADNELWASLHGCLWENGSVDHLDWSWGPYSKQKKLELPSVPTDPEVIIIKPTSDQDRKWMKTPPPG